MVTPSTPAPGAARPGIVRRVWSRLFGEADAIERQLSSIAREGATLARVAHLCAFLMLALFSAGSLVALAGDSIQAIAAGHATFPSIIAASVSGLLVACMDTAMLYAASILRLLATRRAAKAEGRLHRFVLGSVAILEAATYGYMSWRYEAPHDAIAWALIIARALAAPLLSVYLSLARPLPVTARDMLALAERISGEGVLRDLARIAGDTSAPLADKVTLYSAAAVIAPTERTRLEALLDAAQRRAQGAPSHDTALLAEAAPAPATTHTAPSDKPPTGPGSPAQAPRGRKGFEPPAANVVEMPRAPRRRSAARGRSSAEAKIRKVYTVGMSAAEIEKRAHVSRSTASKWRHILQAEADQQAVQ
jgi:hypothetical protein